MQEAFLRHWKIDPSNTVRGGLLPGVPGDDEGPADPSGRREIWLLQRKAGKHGAGLGRTTGWIHRASLKNAGVQMLGGVSYKSVDDSGLHLKGRKEEAITLEVDTVVVCAGQVSHGRYTRPLHMPVTHARYTRPFNMPVTPAGQVSDGRYTRPLHTLVTHGRYTCPLHPRGRSRTRRWSGR